MVRTSTDEAAVASKLLSAIKAGEYVEGKTTTHVFDDVEACLGNDESTWSWQYDSTATTPGVALSGALTRSSWRGASESSIRLRS